MIHLVRLLGAILSIGAALTFALPAAAASSDAKLDADVRNGLNDLYKTTPAAKALGAKAKAILVFPRIVKAGLIIGGQGGDGALLKGNKIVGYYNTGGLSVGLQAGAQAFGYALFLMSDAALKHLESTDGWELGVGPSIVVVDQGAAATLTTTTARSDVYAFFFDQKGLMAGMGLQGTKVSKKQ